MKHKIIAILQIVSWFTVLPAFMSYCWPKNIESPILLQVFSQQITHCAVYVIVNLYYTYFYCTDYKNYKVEKHPWLWDKNPEEWRKLRNDTLIGFIGNIGIGLLMSFTFSSRKIRNRQEYTSFPDTFEIFWQLCIFVLVDDFLLYLTHRTFHHPKLYKYHKQHHKYHVTVSISAEYAHPLEYLTSNLFPVNAGPLLLGLIDPQLVHLQTYCVWIAVRIYKTLAAHSGYEFPWEPFNMFPGMMDAEFHAFHHSYNLGNYGSIFRIWDYIFGTSDEYYKAIKQDHYGLTNLKQE